MQKAFDEIWKKYPRKIGKKEAYKHFKASVRTREDLNKINIALQKYVAHIAEDGTEARYIQYGKTWFYNWEDWYEFETEADKQAAMAEQNKRSEEFMNNLKDS